MGKLRVLIIDDAVVVRQLLSRVLSEDPQIEVVGTAASGRIALQKLERIEADVVILDMDMVESDGMATLTEIRRLRPSLPVIMFSSLSERGARTTLQALSLGATDYITKPQGGGGMAESIERVRSELLPRIRLLGGPHEPAPRPSAAPRARPARHRVEVLAIGSSTGGPNALAELIPRLPRDFPVPVLIVQHMPPIFTRLLSERLSAKSTLPVHEAADGDVIMPGQVLLAPGDHHLALARDGDRLRVKLHKGPPENSCRPAVDVLFRSVVTFYGGNTLAVVLTGMGQDGLKGCTAIRAAGGQVLVQDERSSVVWGMPGAVAMAGLADQVASLDQLGHEVVRRVLRGRTSGLGALHSGTTSGPET